MKKILVTGSNGFLGMKLTEAVLASGNYRLIATGAGPDRYPQPYGYDYAVMDTTQTTHVNDVFDRFRPDVVIHTAAISQVDVCEKDPDLAKLINVEATQNIARASEKQRSHLIYISTDFVFDGKDGPYSETDEPNPQNVYGSTKLAAEKIVGKISTSAILRTILVYGQPVEASRSNLILWVKNELENQRSINVTDDHWRMPTLVEDLARACLAAADRSASGIYHISSDENLSTYQIACRVAEFWDLDGSLIHPVPAEFFRQQAVRPAKTGFIIDKAKDDLDFRPATLEEGLKLMAKQQKQIIK